MEMGLRDKLAGLAASATEKSPDPVWDAADKESAKRWAESVYTDAVIRMQRRAKTGAGGCRIAGRHFSGGANKLQMEALSKLFQEREPELQIGLVLVRDDEVEFAVGWKKPS